MALTIEEYKKKKKEGLIVWDTASMNKTASNYNDFATNYSNQRNYQGERWSDEEFNNQRDNAKGLRDDIQYMEAYANSIKNDDPETYNNIQDILKTVNGGLDEADSWFDQYSDPNKRARYYDQVTNMRREREKSANINAALREIRLGRSTVAEQAQKYGLDEKELEKTSGQIRQIEKQQDREQKYGSMSYDELLNTVISPDNLGQRIYDELINEYGVYLKDYSDFDKHRIFQSRGEKYGLTAEQVEAIFEGMRGNDATRYMSKALSDDDRDYIFQRMIETGNADQIQSLLDKMPQAPYYNRLREQARLAIEEKKEEKYYLDMLQKYPDAERIISESEHTPVKSNSGGGRLGGFEMPEKNEELQQLKEQMGDDYKKFIKFRYRYNQRKKNEEFQKSVAEWTAQNPFTAAVASLLSTPLNMLGSPLDALQLLAAKAENAFGGDAYYDTKGTANYTAQNIRGTVNQMIADGIDNKELRQAAQFLYSTSQSMGDTAVAIAANAIPVAGQFISGAMFFSSAGVSKANEVLENGGSLDQATASMIAYGAAELIFEEVSLDKLKAFKNEGNVKGIKDLLWGMLDQSFVEMSEEVSTTLVTTLEDAIINGDNSEIEQNIRSIMKAKNCSRKEAEKEAWQDWLFGVFEDGLGGALSGAVFSGATGGKALHNYNKAKSNTTVELGGVKLSAKDAQEKSREYYHDMAQKITDSGKTDVINGLIEDAKSGGKKSKALANSIEQTIKEKGSSAVRAADVENLLITLYDENVDAHITGENIGSAVAVYKLEKKVTGEVSASQLKMYNSNFNDAGAKFGSEAAKSNPNAFGNTFKNGVDATDKDGNKVIIKSIDSSVKEYGSDDRTVVLKTADGKTVNADEVTIDNADFERLVNLAGTYDTLGARALLANYEEAQANGVSVDKYIDEFEALYKIGRSGVTFENANKSAEFKSIINSVGANVAQNAMNAGNYDAEGQIELENALYRRVRVGNAKTSAGSRVFTADSGVEIKGDESFVAVMNNIANTIDSDIVLTDRLPKDTRGVYSKGRIYINSELDEHVIAAVALHEAVHAARVYAPAEYRALEKFIMNYLVSTGQDVQTQLDNIASIWGQDAKSREAQIEELVANTVMSLASDEKAFTKAVNLEENKNFFNKVKEAIKNIVARIKEWFKNVDENGVVLGHNMQAQPWLGDVQALEQLAQKFNELTTAAKQNKAEFGERESEGKFAKKGNSQKTYDPVTYDDNGKVIPLSERFNEKKGDYRYSKDDAFTVRDGARAEVENSKETESAKKSNSKSEIEGKSSKDDAFYFDDEGELTIVSSDEGYDVKEVDTKQLLKNSTPDAAIFLIQQRMAQTAQRIIADSPNVKLDEKDKLAIAQRIMSSYGITRKNNAGLDMQIADRIERFISDIVESPKSSFSTHFNSLAIDCRKFLENSGKYERGYLQKTAEKVKSLLRGKTLILPSNVANYILPDYDNSISNIRRSYSGYIDVAFESKKKSVKSPVYMDELMRQIANVQEIKALFENGVTPDSYEGWGFLDNLINNVLQPKFSNPYYNNVYESIDDTATEMAAAIAAAVVDEKAGKGVTMKKLGAQSVNSLTLGRKKMLAENKALHEVKYEKYRKAKQIDKYFVSFEKTNYRREYQERTKKTQYMHQLGKKLNSLTKRLDGKAPKNEYIPEILKKPLLNVLQMFQADPGKNKDGTAKRVPSYFGAFRNLTEVSLRVNELANAYSKLENSASGKANYEYLDFDVNALVFNKGVLNELKDVAEFIQGKNVYQMDSNDLKNVLEVINDLDNSLKNAVQIIVDGKKTTIQEAAVKGIEQTNNVYFSKDGKNFVTTALREARNKFVATSLDPLRYGRMLSGYKDDGIMYQLLSDLHCGEQKKIRIMQQAYTPLQNIMERHKRGELVSVQQKAVEEFKMKDINTGEDVELSQGMLMSIYLTNKQADGHRHLINEKGDNYYTRVPDLKYLNKNRFLPDVQGNNLKAKGEKSHEIRLSKNDLERISDYIENNALLKDLTLEMHNTFNGLLSDEINKVSMQRQGRMIATVKDYFPIQVDKDDPKKKFDINFEGEGVFTDNRLKSRSFTKQRTKSWTAIVIDDALSVFQRHVNEVAEYCGMTIAVENIQKVIASDNGKITMRKAIENKFGQSALHYLNKLLGDIQKRKDNTDENALTRATGHAMGAALAFNPRSSLKNWAALPLANMYFGTNNVAKATFVGLSKQGNKLVEKYSKYTPYMWYRAQGNGTVVGELSRQHGLYGRFAEKLDIMSWADQKVVNSLLYAAEQHVKKTSDLVFDSEEFKQEVARQFEKCVDESQPNSMITSKPQFVRNNVMRVLSLNAFASQRMAMGNGIIDSFMEYSARRHEYHLDKNAENKKAKNEAKKKFARKFFGVIESGLLQALLGTLASALVYHKWDDYKDEDGNVTLQSFGAGLGFNILKNAPEEILGGFVWLDKIYGVVEKLIDKEAYGADFSVMSFSAVEDISNAIKNGNFAKAWGRGMDLLGIPIAFGTNVQRLLQSGSSYVKDIENGKLGFTNNKGEVDYSYMHIQIAHAYENGDGENARWLSELWANSGKKEEGRNEKLAGALADENEDIIDAAISRQNGDLTRHNDVKNKYINMGLSEKLFDKAITKVINKAKKDVEDQKFDTTDDAVQYLVSQGFNESAALKLVEIGNDESSGNKKAKSEYSYKEAFTSLSSGNADSYELAKQSIAEKLVADGEAEDLEEAREKVDKKMKGFQYTKSLFEDYHSVRGEKFSTAREKLLRIYGSEDELKKKYEEFVKKYIN